MLTPLSLLLVVNIVPAPYPPLPGPWSVQVRYILGENPAGMSYMVGYGENYPTRVHHRAASIPSPAVDPTRYDCSSGKQFYK